MDAGEKMIPARERYALLLTALAPVIPQILGSAFNIWYNTTVIHPLLTSPALKQRFFDTIVLYNGVVYPIGVFFWLRRIFSFRDLFHRLRAGLATDSASLTQARRRLIHLPWFAAAICAVAWFLCIPVFLGALVQLQHPLDARLLWHLPISSACLASLRLRIHFFSSNSRVIGDCFPFFFATRAPISRRTSLRFPCGATESCGRFPLLSVRSLRSCS